MKLAKRFLEKYGLKIKRKDMVPQLEDVTGSQCYSQRCEFDSRVLDERE